MSQLQDRMSFLEYFVQQNRPTKPTKTYSIADIQEIKIINHSGLKTKSGSLFLGLAFAALPAFLLGTRAGAAGEIGGSL